MHFNSWTEVLNILKYKATYMQFKATEEYWKHRIQKTLNVGYNIPYHAYRKKRNKKKLYRQRCNWLFKSCFFLLNLKFFHISICNVSNLSNYINKCCQILPTNPRCQTIDPAMTRSAFMAVLKLRSDLSSSTLIPHLWHQPTPFAKNFSRNCSLTA